MEADKMRERKLYDILEKQYEVGETIGRGGFAKVKRATHLVTGERVAIKIMDKVSLGKDLPRVAREIGTLKTLNHPHICKLYQVLETEQKIFMVMEYCSGGELLDYVVQKDRLEENEARRVFRQIASAVSYIHEHGVAHRDLKPENILLDECNNVKLIDFGLCAAPQGGMNVLLETCCGSPAYAAPELLNGERYLGPEADVWSLGVLLYALLNGFLPFDDTYLSILHKKIQSGIYEEPKWLSEGAKNILRCMVQVNPEFRLPVKLLLTHTWCQQGKSDPLPVLNSDPYEPQLELDILQKMSFYLGVPVQALHAKISKWNYASYENSTYLVLVNQKSRYGDHIFGQMPLRVEKIQPETCNRNQKSLDGEWSNCDSVDVHRNPISPSRPYHTSMEGGLDDCSLLAMGSPKVETNKEKENNTEDFIKPRVPTTKKPRMPECTTPTPIHVSALSPARSAESGLNDGPKTPNGEKGRRNVFGSFERGLDRVRLMLTPRTGNKRKLRTIDYNINKGAFNISCTERTDPDAVITDIMTGFTNAGIECEQKGYRLVSKCTTKGGKQVKFELEVVSIAALNLVGVLRKRIHGDSWAYKQVIEQVLSITGVCQIAKKREPLQTTV